MNILLNLKIYYIMCLMVNFFFIIEGNYQCPFDFHQSSRYRQDILLQMPTSPIAAAAVPDTQNHQTSKTAPLFTTNSKDTLNCANPPTNCSNDTNNYIYRTFDGSCNNLNNPGFGMAKAKYTRLLQPKYSDNNFSPTLSVFGTSLPNARVLSLSLYGDDTLPDNFRTMATMQWGQFVAHDISELTKTDAPKDCCAFSGNKYCYPILLPPHDPISYGSGKTCLSFSRSSNDIDAKCTNSKYSNADKISAVTAYLDLSFLYGNSLEQNRKIRKFDSGLLKTSTLEGREWPPISINVDGECGENNYQCYNIPDMRNQFIPTAVILHTIMLREHNRIAHVLTQLNPQHSDEEIFQLARKINIAQYQKITYYDWLPLLIGPSYAYEHGLIHYVQNDEFVNDYDINVNSAPYAEYSAAAFRYAHNQIPGWFTLVSPHRDRNLTMRLSDYFERSENINFIAYGDNFDSMVRGLITQLQKRPDSNIDKEIKHYFDRKPFEEFGGDLKAMDIQRGRDYGIASYNDYRQFCGLQRAVDWTGFSGEIQTDKISLMQRLYASPEDVDLNVGGSLETHSPESVLGPTFQCIIGRQLLKTRIGDRFFFERENVYGGFTPVQLAEIRKTSLSSLLCNNGDYLQFIQTNSFIFPNTKNILKNCDRIPQLDLTKWTVT